MERCWRKAKHFRGLARGGSVDRTPRIRPSAAGLWTETRTQSQPCLATRDAPRMPALPGGENMARLLFPVLCHTPWRRARPEPPGPTVPMRRPGLFALPTSATQQPTGSRGDPPPHRGQRAQSWSTQSCPPGTCGNGAASRDMEEAPQGGGDSLPGGHFTPELPEGGARDHMGKHRPQSQGG